MRITKQVTKQGEEILVGLSYLEATEITDGLTEMLKGHCGEYVSDADEDGKCIKFVWDENE